MVLDFMKVKENRIRVFRRLWKWYGDQDFMITSSELKSQYHTNPNLGSRLLIIRQALYIEGDKVTGNIYDLALPSVIEAVYNKYWDRFLKNYAYPRVLKSGDGQKGEWPTMYRTRAISEFIARGFKHKNDVKIDVINRYCIKANISDLWWPEDFETHGDALEVFNRMGISGLTGTTLPKKK